MKQLSIFDVSTDVNDYLNEIEFEDIAVDKKLSKSINSKGYSIIKQGSERICYVFLRNCETFVQISIRSADDWTGIAIPCPFDLIGEVLNAAIAKFLGYDDSCIQTLFEIARS